MSGTVDFEASRSAAFTRRLNIIAAGVGADLTGHVIRFEVRRAVGDTVIHLAVDSATVGGIVWLDQAHGDFRFAVPVSKMTLVPRGCWPHRVFIIPPEGDDFAKLLLEGEFEVDA